MFVMLILSKNDCAELLLKLCGECFNGTYSGVSKAVVEVLKTSIWHGEIALLAAKLMYSQRGRFCEYYGANKMPKFFCTLSVALVLVLTGLHTASSTANAQLVFDVSVIDGSFAQPSITDASSVIYGLQPFVVTTTLASASSLAYHSAFSTDRVNLANSNLTGLDVRSWDRTLLYISTLEDALSGIPTAYLVFNLLEATAANGQQFQDLITTQQGPNGETHHTFVAVANLGESLDGNDYHQLTETFSMDTLVTLQNDTTTTLGQFLTSNIGQTLYLGSLIDNGASQGAYEVAATPNLGMGGVSHSPLGGNQVPAGFAHLISAVTAEPLLGDVNLDGEVTFSDIAPFIAVLAAETFQAEADTNQDGGVDFFDIASFIAILSGQ